MMALMGHTLGYAHASCPREMPALTPRKVTGSPSVMGPPCQPSAPGLLLAGEVVPAVQPCAVAALAVVVGTGWALDIQAVAVVVAVHVALGLVLLPDVVLLGLRLPDVFLLGLRLPHIVLLGPTTPSARGGTVVALDHPRLVAVAPLLVKRTAIAGRLFVVALGPCGGSDPQEGAPQQQNS